MNHTVGDTKANILIVDDHLSVREMLRGLLSTEGYTMSFATNGLEALSLIDQINPDVILLDVMMPDMDGFEVSRRLKAETRWQHIPIILVTALDSPDDLVNGLDAGADDFLSKPVNSAELKARVRSMLRMKHQYDALQQKQQELEAALHLNQKFSQVIAQHLEAMEVLHQTGLRLMEDNLSMDSVLTLIPQTALELIPEASGCIFHFLAGDEQELLPVVFSATEKKKQIYPSVGIEKIVKGVIGTGRAVHIPDVTTTSFVLPPQLAELQTLMVQPLSDGQQTLGTLSLYGAESNAFQASHSYILSILATQATVIIGRARFFEAKTRSQEQEKRSIRNLFQRYVSPSVVKRLVDGRATLALGGQRQEISVLFADIRGFTTFAEKIPPEVLVKVLNSYLGLAVEAILAYEGTLDKFMGDAVMAIFNAPLTQPDHTLRAVKAALAMQQAIIAFNSSTANDYRLSFGIGIHVGKAVAGNIGTTQQMNYTVIGDTVNLAKRLQENAQGGQIILSQAAYEVVQDTVTVEDLGMVMVKGRTTAEHIYTLTGLISSKSVA